MANFKKIILFLVFFLVATGSISYSEIIKKVEVQGNERISPETILIFGDILK